MVKPIIKDEAFLSKPSSMATTDDLQIADDLLDTLQANHERCVGMAANMIGESKRIIAVNDNGTLMLLINPEIVKTSQAYEAEEGCLSLIGLRKAKRYQNIKVRYQNRDFQIRWKTFQGFTAQIIQHEIDHCNGIII